MNVNDRFTHVIPNYQEFKKRTLIAFAELGKGEYGETVKIVIAINQRQVKTNYHNE